jgi:uncharacterized membrane protein YGL010W
MVESIVGLLITAAICYLVIWLVDKIAVPAPFTWVAKAVVILVLIVWVLQKYGVYNASDLVK